MDGVTVWVLFLLGAIAAAAAGVFFGLWMGERGRRRDLGWLVGQRVPDSGDGAPSPEVERIPVIEEERIEELELEAVTSSLMEQAELAGKPVSEQEARAEAFRLLQELYSIGTPR